MAKKASFSYIQAAEALKQLVGLQLRDTLGFELLRIFCGYGDVYRDYLVENTLRTNDYNAWYEEVTAGSSYTTYGFPMMFVKSR